MLLEGGQFYFNQIKFNLIELHWNNREIKKKRKMKDVNCKGIKLHLWREISSFFNNDVALKLET